MKSFNSAPDYREAGENPDQELSNDTEREKLFAKSLRGSAVFKIEQGPNRQTPEVLPNTSNLADERPTESDDLLA